MMNEPIIINTEALPPVLAAAFKDWQRQSIHVDDMQERINAFLKAEYNATIRLENATYRVTWWKSRRVLWGFSDPSWLRCFEWVVDNIINPPSVKRQVVAE